MDEFEKINPEAEKEEAVAENLPVETPEEPDVAEAAAEETDSQDELKEELEEIRDMFQKELDEAGERIEGGELIQELDEAAQETFDEIEEEIDPALLCECCGENVKSKDFGEDYPYCDSCREIMKRYPLRWSGIATVFLSIVIFVVTTGLAFSVFDSSMAAGEAAILFDSGKLISALQSSTSYIQSAEQDSVSMKLVKKTIDGFMKTGYITDAVSYIETYFSETELKLPWNKKYQKILDENDIIQDTYYTVTELITPAANGEEYDYDKIMKELDNMRNPSTENLKEGEEPKVYNAVFVEYYRFILMSIAKKDLETQLEQLKVVDSIGEGYEWVYLSNLCATAAALSDEETMLDAFERAIAINKEDSNAYIAKAQYYRFLDKPDADKILEVCQEASENAASSDMSYKQYEAIAYLLKGEGAMALEAIEECVSYSYTVQTCNLYALCALYNGNEEVYDEMKSLLEGSGYEISNLVTKYKNGKITIEKILADKGGDI